METHVQICEENRVGNCPIIYNGKYSDMDFVNRDVIAGELLQNLFNTFHDCDITPENLNKTVDKGHKVVIKLWKEDVTKK